MQHPRHDRPRRGGHRQDPSTPSHHYSRRGSRSSPRHQFDPRRAPRHADVESSTAGQEIKLVTNAYSIVTADRPCTIYEYELFVEPSSGCKDLPAKVLSRAYVSRSIRQLIMSDLVPSLLNIKTAHGTIIIGPNLEAIYSIVPFGNYGARSSSSFSSPVNHEFRFSNITVATDLISHLSVEILIRLNRTLATNPLKYSASLLGSIIHHQLMIKMLRYGSVYYSLLGPARQTTERLDLISRHLIGIAISGVRKSDEDQSHVVINSSHSYITQTYRLIDLLTLLMQVGPVELRHELGQTYEDIRRHQSGHLASIRGDENLFIEFCTYLNGYKCRATELGGLDINLRFNLTDQPASALSMDGVTSVLDFYYNMGIMINYPNLPCLKSRSSYHPYHPLEMCSLLPGQKVPIFRLNPYARNDLILKNKPSPRESRRASIEARDEVADINKTHFDAFGVELSHDPVEASGWTLNKPILQYKHNTIYPQRDFWESNSFYQPIDLVNNWCVVDTVGIDNNALMSFLKNFIEYSARLGLQIGSPPIIFKPKQEILNEDSIETIIRSCSSKTKKSLRFVLFVIDSASTQINRMIHLVFDEHPDVSATCLREDSVRNERQQRSIFRTLVHKVNSRLGGTNFVYHEETFNQLSLDSSELMIVGLDVTHPDNELNGVSIVGCAYTFCKDLFRHKSLVWPQAARKEIITKMDALFERLLNEYKLENSGRLPRQVIVYRDGVSHEEFDRVRDLEIAKARCVIDEASRGTRQARCNLSYIIAQKRHTMRFFQETNNGVQNPPGGTLINKGLVSHEDREFYLFSNTSPQATARPLHYHVILNGLGLENLQKLTYYLCFNFGKCSSSLSMPSALRYAHNAAYDARNRVIASKEFSENKFYTTKFFC